MGASTYIIKIKNEWKNMPANQKSNTNRDVFYIGKVNNFEKEDEDAMMLRSVLDDSKSRPQLKDYIKIILAQQYYLMHYVSESIYHIAPTEHYSENFERACAIKINQLDPLDPEEYREKINDRYFKNIDKVARIDLDDLEKITENEDLIAYVTSCVIKANNSIINNTDVDRLPVRVFWAHLRLAKANEKQLLNQIDPKNPPTPEQRLAIYQELHKLYNNAQLNGYTDNDKAKLFVKNRVIFYENEMARLQKEIEQAKPTPVSRLQDAINASVINKNNPGENDNPVDVFKSKILTTITNKHDIYANQLWKPTHFSNEMNLSPREASKIQAMIDIINILNKQYDSPANLLYAMENHLSQIRNRNLENLKETGVFSLSKYSETFNEFLRDTVKLRNDLAEQGVELQKAPDGFNAIVRNAGVQDNRNESAATTKTMINSPSYGGTEVKAQEASAVTQPANSKGSTNMQAGFNDKEQHFKL